MPGIRRPSKQTRAVLGAMADRSERWFYGLELAELTGLKSGSLYPILMQCAERGMLESRWLDRQEAGRPPRHVYRIRPEGLRILEAAASRGSPTKLKVQMI
jgi:PadR family transcriptional regulator PadR